MTVWTTPKYRVLFPEDASVEVLPQEQAKKAFLSKAAPGDMAVLGLEQDHMDFLATAKSRGIMSPVVFLTPEAAGTGDELAPYNAVVLELRKIGVPEAMRIVNFIARIAGDRITECAAAVPLRPAGAGGGDGGPLESPVDAGEVISHHVKARVPVVAALQFCRAGEVFTARLTCEVKSLGDDSLVLHRFRPGVVTGDLKLRPSCQGTSHDDPFRHGHDLELSDTAVAIFSHRDRSYEAVLSILEINGEKMTAAMPGGLLHERRRHVRVEPDPSEPVELFVLLPGEPTLGVTLTDISQGGVGFVSERELGSGEVHDYAVIVPEPRAVVLARGEIRFKRKQGAGFRYGVSLGLHPWDEEKIFRYIMRRELEIIDRLRRAVKVGYL